MSTMRQGDRISNYLLEERIGGGSFGEVWRARHHVFGDVVAVKIPTDRSYVRNLQREGLAIHGLSHPNIVRAIDLDPYADPPYLIMEYVEGPSLRAVIDHYHPKEGFPIDAAVQILRGVLRALSHAHGMGLIHRDIKPANILLHHPLERLESIHERAVKVTDFGLGKVGGVTAQSLMQSGSLMTDEGRSIVGTISYMSPEQREGREVDARSDLYSCGIVLFEVLTGQRPQGHDSPSSVCRNMPPVLDAVFQRAYTRLERRFRSADDMLRMLHAVHAVPCPPPALPAPPHPVRFAPSAVRVCPKCGTMLGTRDRYCTGCGQELGILPRCVSCLAYGEEGDRFCIHCGRPTVVKSSWIFG